MVSGVSGSPICSERKVSVFLTLEFGRSYSILVFEVVESARSVMFLCF